MKGEGLEHPPAVPRALKIVAWLFIASGLLAGLSMAVNAAQGDVRLQLDLLGLWIGPGLMNVKPKWLRWAKRFIWLDLVGIDLLGLIVSTSHESAKYHFGPWSGVLSDKGTVVFIVGVACVGLWKLRVLKRPEIEELFLLDSAPDDWRTLTTKPRLQASERLSSEFATRVRTVRPTAEIRARDSRFHPDP